METYLMTSPKSQMKTKISLKGLHIFNLALSLVTQYEAKVLLKKTDKYSLFSIWNMGNSKGITCFLNIRIYNQV